MVDIVVNNIPSLTVAEATDGGALAAAGSRWTDPSQFHPQCWIDYNNQTSVEYWYVPFLRRRDLSHADFWLAGWVMIKSH